MTQENKAPLGTILVTREGWDKKLYYVEDLKYMNELTIGQLFFAVAGFYGKTREAYGQKWIQFLNHQYEVSNAFKFMKAELEKLDNDYDKLVKVCEHLEEPQIEAIPVEELK